LLFNANKYQNLTGKILGYLRNTWTKLNSFRMGITCWL